MSLWLSYLQSGISNTGKMTSLFWIMTQIFVLTSQLPHCMQYIIIAIRRPSCIAVSLCGEVSRLTAKPHGKIVMRRSPLGFQYHGEKWRILWKTNYDIYIYCKTMLCPMHSLMIVYVESLKMALVIFNSSIWEPWSFVSCLLWVSVQPCCRVAYYHQFISNWASSRLSNWGSAVVSCRDGHCVCYMTWKYMVYILGRH